MKNTQHMLHRMIAVGLVLGLALFGVISCDQGDESSSPSGINPITYSNFDVQGAVSNEYGVNKGDGYFQVNVPEAGDYRLTYTTELGTFYLLFRAEGGALLTIGLTQYADGTYDEVSEVSLETGAIAEDGAQDAGNMSIVVIGIVTVYSWQDNHGNPIPWQGPGGGNPQSGQPVTFTSYLVIILIAGGEVQSSSGGIVIVKLNTDPNPPTDPGGGGGGTTCTGGATVAPYGDHWVLSSDGGNCDDACDTLTNCKYDTSRADTASGGNQNAGACNALIIGIIGGSAGQGTDNTGGYFGCYLFGGTTYSHAIAIPGGGVNINGGQVACPCTDL